MAALLASTRLCLALVLCAGLLTARAAVAQTAELVGSWHGTSTCVDLEHFPNCHDEEVIFDAVARGASGDTVSVRADKIVQGHREFMGELEYVRGSDGVWTAEFHNARTHIRLTLRVARDQRDRLLGRIIDVPSGRTVRDQALTRVH